MRRPASLAAAFVAPLTAVAVLIGLVTTAAPAAAGGPTSVLVVNYSGARAAAALTGSEAYAALERALEPYQQPTGETLPEAAFMESPVRLTWMIHDVTPWRIDAVVVQGKDVWVQTTMNLGTGVDLFESPTVRHRPKDATLLVATLTSLGVLGESTPAPGAAGRSPVGAGASADTPTAAPVAAPGLASVAPPGSVGPESPAGVPWWVLVTTVALALGLGVAGGRRVHDRGVRRSAARRV
ncbi:MAG TPA: hypothetical protein VFL38_09215 [Humibacillus xanthopallidus]|nr:hypothetical protein [Humibacillus xanthopallidus]